MSEPGTGSSPADSPDPLPDLAEAMRALNDDLATLPLPEHHDRLAAAHDLLHAALHDRPPAG